MNKEIEKFYLDRIDSNEFTEGFIKDTFVAGIRCDNAELVRKASKKMIEPYSNFYGYISPLEYAIKEMASRDVLEALMEADYRLLYDKLTPFIGSPQMIVDLLLKTDYDSKEDAIELMITDIGYFFHVIKTNYSCFRIPYDVDYGDKYNPCFWNYLDEWLSDFIKLLSKEGLEIINSDFARSIIENVELEKAFDTFFSLFGKAYSKDDYIWYINIAVSKDNEYAFEKLLEYDYSLIKEVNHYPSSSKKILSDIFDASVLIPGSNDAFKAFIEYIQLGIIDKDILISISHPSYSERTYEDGRTPLMLAVMNENFPPMLYKQLITTPKDVNMQDVYGRAIA